MITVPHFVEERFKECNWEEYYPGAKEAIPMNKPEPRGKLVTMSCFVDADHAGCCVTRRSHSGIITFVNRAPILWYSKRQNTVELSTFGSKLIAMRTAIEMIEGLRYKLRMFGVEIDGPCNTFGDNQAVISNVVAPESQLKKKHAAISYHRVRASTMHIASKLVSSWISWGRIAIASSIAWLIIVVIVSIQIHR
jgi:hypothetical protein